MNDVININPTMNEVIDKLQVAMSSLPQVEIKPSHLFLPGLYIREIIIPAGVGAVTKIHKSAHPVFVCGICDVYNVLTDEVVHIHGYWKGITEPCTRRVFNVISETIVSTVHPIPFVTGLENGYSDIEKEALALEIEKFLIEPHELEEI
jgi:hypothetical protein